MIPEITLDSVIFYSILSIWVLLLSYIAEKSNNFLPVIVLISLLCGVAGFRNINVGRDTENYVQIFKNAHDGLVYSKDPGFGAICRILMCFNNYSFCFLVFSVIIYGLIISRLWELRNYTSFCISVFSFYSFYYFETLNIMRQFCAIAIIFWGSRYIINKSYSKYIICVLLATLCFHRSAIIGGAYLAFEFFSWKKLSKLNKKLLMFGLLGCITGGGLLLPKIMIYTQQYKHYFYVKNENIGLRVPALFAIVVFSLIVYKGNKDKIVFCLIHRYSDNTFSLEYIRFYTVIYYIVGACLSAIGYFYDVTQRIGYYFILYIFVYFGMLFKFPEGKYKFNTKAIQIFMVFIVVLYVLLGYLLRLNGSFHHPYRFIWQ